MANFKLGIFILLVMVYHSFTLTQDFILNINEDGSNFDEKIEIDEEQQTILFRVPPHNNIEDTTFLNDFKLGLTIARHNLKRVCYVSRMDPELSSPKNLKEDLIQASLQPEPLPVTTKTNLMMMTGPANRTLLAQKILDFCGMFPIYNVVTVDKRSLIKEIIGFNTTRHRIARYVKKAEFVPCNKALLMGYIQNCMNAHWDLFCKFQPDECFYMVRCVSLQPKYDAWDCKREHLRNRHPICCDLICSQ